ncbi:MAG: GFA family protein [Paracoccaceae bacterium]
MPDAALLHAGSCLCGAVRYATPGPLRPIVACHCGQCRKTSGNFVAATSAPRDTLRIDGEVTWFASSATARRGFCATCGSNLFWDGAGANLSIHAGTLDGDPGVRLRGHIYVADKGAWYDIEGELPQFEGSDLAMTTRAP